MCLQQKFCHQRRKLRDRRNLNAGNNAATPWFPPAKRTLDTIGIATKGAHRVSHAGQYVVRYTLTINMLLSSYPQCVDHTFPAQLSFGPAIAFSVQPISHKDIKQIFQFAGPMHSSMSPSRTSSRQVCSAVGSCPSHRRAPVNTFSICISWSRYSEFCTAELTHM